ncbi:MAG: hypothetical protein AAF699_07905 [Pseudomonadota bacterium]
MNVLETEWWTMALPPEWWADTDEDSIVIGDRDEVGSIQISTLHKSDGVFESQDVFDVAHSEAGSTAQWQSASLGEFRGLTRQFQEDDAALREWYVALGSMMLYITYSCALENAGMDDAAVDELLDTLLPVS